MVDTRPAKKSLDGIQGEADRLPRGIPVPVSKSGWKEEVDEFVLV